MAINIKVTVNVEKGMTFQPQSMGTTKHGIAVESGFATKCSK